jgi:hypothetical protein
MNSCVLVIDKADALHTRMPSPLIGTMLMLAAHCSILCSKALLSILLLEIELEQNTFQHCAVTGTLLCC